MAEQSKVKLHGMWASPYVKRVELALKLKGIPYDYVEEDLWNKSELLLQLNPVHKLVPVLVHGGKPLCESLVIIEYIDETWPNAHRLLPQDAYERAKVRFWATFLQQQVRNITYKLPLYMNSKNNLGVMGLSDGNSLFLYDHVAKVIRRDGEVQEKAIKEVHEKLQILEQHMEEIFPGGNPLVEDQLGLLDLMMAQTMNANKAIEEAFGLKLIDPEKYPLVYSWMTSLHEIPVVRETAAPSHKMVGLLHILRKMGLMGHDL
ncbi:unnamed protein product [Ilex paraguariensis]|uniref:glutathione transferase n=1 Tax=Ilex paraguariensis TaxID=185542 RepID=A0ABC8SNZ4_9AQUA